MSKQDIPSSSHSMALGSLAVLIVCVFGVSLGHPFLVYDDLSYILLNPSITHPGQVPLAELLLTLSMNYVVPVTILSQALQYALGDGEAWIFHLTSLVVHLLVVAQVYVLGVKMSGSRLAAWCGAVIFSVHPIVVEAVCWATGQKDLFMTFLSLAATWCFLQTLSESAHRRWVVGAVMLASLAMLSKPTVVFLGFAWILMLCAYRLAGRALPQPRLSWAAAGLTVLVGAVVGGMNYFAYNVLLTSASSYGSGPLPMGMALGYQVHHLMWPEGLHPLYNIDRDAGFADLHTFVGLGVLAVLVGLVVRTRRHPYAWLCFGLAAVGWLPVSNLLPFPRFLADSYAYLSLAAMMMLLSVGLARLMSRSPLSEVQTRWAVAGSCAVIVAALVVHTVPQVERWEGSVAMWKPVQVEYPDWYMGYALQGSGHVMREEHAQAIEAFRQVFARHYDVQALGSLSVALSITKRHDEAECVMLESVWYGNNLKGWHNLLVQAALYPDRVSAYPKYTRPLLKEGLERAKTGKFRLEPWMMERLEARTASWPVTPLGERWPRGTCSVLQRVDSPSP